MKINFKKHVGMAYEIMMFGMVIILFAIMYGVGQTLVQGLQSWQITNYPAGVYNPSTLAFIHTVWVWLPALVIIVITLDLWMKAHKRANPYGN